MKIIIRTVGGDGIGLGHFYRCLSLAQGLWHYGEENSILFIINKGLEKQLKNYQFPYRVEDDFDQDIALIERYKPKLFILDTYLVDDFYLEKVATRTYLVLFDDTNKLYDTRHCHIVINGSSCATKLGYEMSEQSKTRYLLGLQYLPLRKEYWNDQLLGKEQNTKAEKGILITTGGTDSTWISYHLAMELKPIDTKKTLIIGPHYSSELVTQLEELEGHYDLVKEARSLKPYIQDAKIIITAGGTTVYEAMALGKNPLIFSMADNQDEVCKELDEKGIFFGGKDPYIHYNELKKVVEKRLESRGTEKIKVLETVDGGGIRRIVRELKKVLDEE